MSDPPQVAICGESISVDTRTEVVRACEALDRELFGIRESLTVFHQIVGRDKETTDLLNNAAGEAFAYVAVLMWREILLGLARLCDPPRQGKFQNCSLPLLAELIGKDGRTDLAEYLGDRIQAELVDRCELLGLQLLRNKRLAHNDHLIKLEELQSPDQLGGPTMRQCYELMRSQRQILARVSECYDLGFYDHSQGGYEGRYLGNLVPMSGRGFDYLIGCLKEGRTPEPMSLEDLF